MTRQTAAALFLLILATAVPAAGDAWAQSLRMPETVSETTSLRQQVERDPALQAAIQSLRAEAASQGSVQVAVKTHAAFAPEHLLAESERLAQRRDIAAAAQALRAALPEASDFAPRVDIPYVLMRLDSAGLARLETIPGVVRIAAADAFNWRLDFVKLRRADQAAATAGVVASQRFRPRIVGGSNADALTHPFQVGLLAKSISNNYNAQFCGGTLVAARYVVTAAHCSDSLVNPGSEVQVLAGTQRLDGTGQRINVQRVHLHPGWNPNSFDNDVAVWELATPVTGIAFASLATVQPSTPGTALRVTGWGTLAYQNNNSPTLLQQVDVPFVPTVSGACQSQGGITSRMICAGQTGKDSCQGDSGGPLTINRGSGYTELVGIVSFGSGCGDANFPGVYTNVAQSSISTFIRNLVQATAQTISFTATASSVNEGSRRILLTVQRSSGSGTASVNYTTAVGTASGSSDFMRKSGTLRFAKGRTTAEIAVSIVNDRIRESDETFTVTLSGASTGWSITNGTATVTVIDND
jgi:secreted trypsin-like serine protease